MLRACVCLRLRSVGCPEFGTQSVRIYNIQPWQDKEKTRLVQVGFFVVTLPRFVGSAVSDYRCLNPRIIF